MHKKCVKCTNDIPACSPEDGSRALQIFNYDLILPLYTLYVRLAEVREKSAKRGESCSSIIYIYIYIYTCDRYKQTEVFTL